MSAPAGTNWGNSNLTDGADVDQLHAAVLAILRIGGLEQLLLAETNRFDARRADAERIDQRFADRRGPLLAQLQIGLAAAPARRCDRRSETGSPAGTDDRASSPSGRRPGMNSGRIRAEPRSKLIAIVSWASFSSSSVKGGRFIRLARAGSLRLCSAIWRRRAAVNVGAGLFDALQAVDEVARAQLDLSCRGGRIDRRLVAGIGDRFLARRAEAGLRLGVTFHQIAVAGHDALAEAPDIGAADLHHRRARLRPRAKKGLHLAQACLAARRDGGAICSRHWLMRPPPSVALAQYFPMSARQAAASCPIAPE